MRSICSKTRSEGGRTYGTPALVGGGGYKAVAPTGQEVGDVVKWNDIFYGKHM